MIAVDTNVLVRFLTGDDPRQAAAAKSLLATETVWIAKTVLLQTGWVLRSLYGFEESVVLNALKSLLGLRNVHVEDESSVAASLELAAHGIGLADALHWSSKPPGVAFATFDRSFIRRAKRAGAADVCGLPANK